MLTDSKLRSQVDSLWDKFWSGGLTNPLLESYRDIPIMTARQFLEKLRQE